MDELTRRSKGPSVFYTATQGEPVDEVGRFLDAVARSDLPAAGDVRAGLRAETWESALELAVRGGSSDQPAIVVIDELPYLRPREPVVEPLSPADIGALLELAPAEALDAYVTIGGFPVLALEWGAGRSRKEYLAEALTEIAKRTGLSATTLARSLEILDAKGVVDRLTPYSTKPAPRTRRYRVADPYLRFWLRFVGPHIDEIDRGRGPSSSIASPPHGPASAESRSNRSSATPSSAYCPTRAYPQQATSAPTGRAPGRRKSTSSAATGNQWPKRSPSSARSSGATTDRSHTPTPPPSPPSEPPSQAPMKRPS